MEASRLLLLHSRADRQLRAMIDGQLDEHNLTFMEWLVLSVVQAGPKTGLSMSEVSRELDVTLPQVTALMTSLVKKKHIALKTQRKDRRSRHALLTSKGNLEVVKVSKEVQQLVDTLTAELPPANISNYVAVLSALADRPSEK